MQVVRRHERERNPLETRRLMVRRVDAGVVLGERDHRVVAPVAVIVGKHPPHVESRRIDTDFFFCLAHRRADDVFVRVAGPARQCPRASAVRPLGAQLQQHAGLVTVGTNHQQPRRTVQAPVRVTARAANEAVTVAARHGVRRETGRRSARRREGSSVRRPASVMR